MSKETPMKIVEKSPDSTEMVTRELPYLLTAQELNNLGLEMANSVAELGDLEEKKANYMAEHKKSADKAKALMVRDPVLMRLAAAWPQVKRQLPDPPSPGQEVDLETLWQKTAIDFQGWAELAQVDALMVMQGWKVLMGNGVILPDGTLNHLADSVLKKEAAGQLLNQFGVKPGEVKK